MIYGCGTAIALCEGVSEDANDNTSAVLLASLLARVYALSGEQWIAVGFDAG